MKATIEIPQRPILASEPAMGVVEDRHVRGRRRRPASGVVAAAAILIVFSVAVAAWAMVGDSGAQLVETEPEPPPATTPPAEPHGGPTDSGADRGVLVVDVGGPAVVTGTGTEKSSSASPEAAAGGGLQATIEPDVTRPSGPATDPSRTTPTTASALRGGAPSTTPRLPAGSSPTTAGRSIPATATSSPTTTPTSTRPASDGGVAWEEHFTSLDTGRWEIEHSTYGDGNGERQCYQPGNVRVANGRLVLTAKAETATCPNGSTRTVTSGMVRSRGLTFSPGQAIEFRVKLTPPDPSNQAGLWPAVWASSWAGSWPRGGELDFLEVMTAEDPSRAVFSMHYADPSGGHELQNKAVPMSGHFSGGWHTIRFDYGRNGNLAWFMDGSKVFSVSAADTAQGYPAPFDRTIDEIKVNLAIGGTPGPLAAGALGAAGATFEIDFIKVFDL